MFLKNRTFIELSRTAVKTTENHQRDTFLQIVSDRLVDDMKNTTKTMNI